MRLLGLLGMGVLLWGCGGPVTEFTIRDLRAGQARAEAGGDPVWAGCYKVLADDLDARSHASHERPVGLADAAMAAHLLYRQSQEGVPSLIKEKCAGVALEVLVFLARAGLKVTGLPF